MDCLKKIPYAFRFLTKFCLHNIRTNDACAWGTQISPVAKPAELQQRSDFERTDPPGACKVVAVRVCCSRHSPCSSTIRRPCPTGILLTHLRRVEARTLASIRPILDARENSSQGIEVADIIKKILRAIKNRIYCPWENHLLSEKLAVLSSTAYTKRSTDAVERFLVGRQELTEFTKSGNGTS